MFDEQGGAWKTPPSGLSMIECYFCWVESGLGEDDFGMLLMYCLVLNQKSRHSMELLKIVWDFRHWLD